MRVLALEPFYGGSHKAFLDGWVRRSRHRWTLLTLPARKWKWRMRQAAPLFAAELAERVAGGQGWDRLLCSDMLHLAELEGLAPRCVAELPAVVYFHENQLTHPVRVDKERDLHFAISNLWTALAADAVWFNSAFHREELLAAAPKLLRRMPDARPAGVAEAIAERSAVEPPGVPEPPPRAARTPGPLRVLWAARWEWDKAPEVFFRAVTGLVERDVPLRLSVVGEAYRERPEVFDRARSRLADRIDHWGWLTRPEYRRVLAQADVFVSTAEHEFFGLAAVEAMVAGVRPLLPERLSYPELLEAAERPDVRECLYRGGARGLARKLRALAEGALPPPRPPGVDEAVARFLWPRRAAALDAALEEVEPRGARANRPAG